MTVRIRPFVYAVPSVGRRCVVTLSCLAVMIVCLVAEGRFWECAIVAGCAAGSVFATLLPALTRRQLFLPRTRQRRSVVLSAAVEGVITAMILPSSFPPVAAFLLTFIFSLAAVSLAPRTKTFSARSALNVPAIVACSAWVVGSRAGSALMPQIAAWDTAVTDALNNSVFSVFGVAVPSGYMSLFWSAPDAVSSCCRFNIITLLSSVVLFSCDMAEGMVTGVFLFVYLALVRLAGPAMYGGGDMLMAALTGGTLFCAVFVINRPGTLPMSRAGRWVYAVSCGVLAFFIAGPLPKIRDIPFAILCGNVISILIRYVEDAFTDFVSKRARAAKAVAGGGE